MTNEQNIFVTKEASGNAAASRGLQKTAELTYEANAIAKNVLQIVLNDVEYREAIVNSQKNSDAMDKLISDLYEITENDYGFLKDAAAEELEKMLKSQQSKRSRTKSMPMTLENYTNLMTASAAELLLRAAMGIPKGASGSGLRKSSVGYSDEELEALANNQEALTKAIRNVQSKKSIAKSKAGFDENSDYFQELLLVEEQLKALREKAQPVNQELFAKAGKVDEVNELLKDVGDVENMNESDSKSLLDRIKKALATE